MAKKHFIVCDGCGHEQQVAEPEGKPPSDFMHVQITVGVWGTTADLCQHCHGRLIETADPKKWPRAREAKVA